MRPEYDAAVSGRVLEGVVQQVHHGRREELRVRVDEQRRVNRIDGELDVPILRMEHACGGYFVDESHHGQTRTSLVSSREANFGKRAVDDFSKAHQAAAEDRSGATVDRDGALLHQLETEKRGVQDVSKLVSRMPEPLEFFA